MGRATVSVSAALSSLAMAIGVCLLLLAMPVLALADAAVAVDVLPGLFSLANLLIYVAVTLGRSYGILSVLTAFFFLFFVAVPAQVQIALSAFPFGAHYSADALDGGYAVLVVGELALLAGGLLARRAGNAEGRAAFVPPSARLRLRFILGIVAYCAVVAAVVGLGALSHNRFDSAASAPDAGGPAQLILVGRSLSLLGAVLCLSLWRHRSQKGISGPSLGFVTVAMGAFFVLFNLPASLPRFQLLGAVISLACLLVPVFSRLTKVVVAVTAPVFLVVLFAGVKAVGSGQLGQLGQPAGRSIRDYLTTSDFDGFKQTVDTWIYAQDYPLRHGENFLGALLFWVPRGSWPGKPVHSGAVVSSALGYPFTNVSNPLPAEGYISWGIGGTVVVMALAGAWLARTERRCALELAQPGGARVLVLYALACGFVIIVMRGALDAIFPMVAPAFVAYAVLAHLERNPRPAGAVRCR